MTRHHVIHNAARALATLAGTSLANAGTATASTEGQARPQPGSRLTGGTAGGPMPRRAVVDHAPRALASIAPAGTTATTTSPIPSGLAGLHAPAGSGASPVQHTFAPHEARALAESARVLVLEYSSTGGGHTDRSLLPVMEAKSKGVLKDGDAVVLLAPPRWPHDTKGSHVNNLHNRRQQLSSMGLNVILKQTDKTVTGLYKPDGASNNVDMLRDFVYKPRRGAEVDVSNRLPTGEGHRPQGPGQPAKQILDDLISVVGHEHLDKIVVMGDMAPFLHKAARARGIPTRVEVGNHQALFVGKGRDELGAKDLSYLAKASSSGQFSHLALIDYNKTMNVLPTLPNTFKALGIEPGTSKEEARTVALQHLMDHAKRNPLEKGAPWNAGVLVAEGAKPESIKAMVYLYVNDYTPALVDHLREKIAKEPKTYGATLFAVCGGGAFKPMEGPRKEAGNIMHVMYAANADGITSAGFGTTSEFHYLHHHGYQGKFIVAPVENQHEQGANAAELKDLCAPGTVMRADGLGEIKAHLDSLVAQRTSEPRGAAWQAPMEDLHEAAGRKSRPEQAASNAEHAARLLQDPATPQSDKTHASVAAMAAYDADHAPKERRRMYKLVVPALDSMIRDEPASGQDGGGSRKITPFSPSGEFHVLATQKGGEPKRLDVPAAIQLMRQAAQVGPEGDSALKDLLEVEIRNVGVKQQLAALADELERLTMVEDLEQRSQQAKDMLRRMAEQDIALGW